MEAGNEGTMERPREYEEPKYEQKPKSIAKEPSKDYNNVIEIMKKFRDSLLDDLQSLAEK